jgi:hypothetical protein
MVAIYPFRMGAKAPPPADRRVGSAKIAKVTVLERAENGQYSSIYATRQR